MDNIGFADPFRGWHPVLFDRRPGAKNKYLRKQREAHARRAANKRMKKENKDEGKTTNG